MALGRRPFTVTKKKMKTTIIIQASERSTGNTFTLCDFLSKRHDINIIDLKQKNIGHFDYDFNNQGDDFLKLISNIIQTYDRIIFATPVYWYSMSGRMKVFFDRLSDLLTIEKELGRQLRGKEMGVMSCGSDAEIKDGFYMPFVESAAYLGMTYIGDVHGWIDENEICEVVKERLIGFGEKFR